MTTLRDLSSTPTLVASPLDPALYHICLCLVASNKPQIKWYEVKKAAEILEMAAPERVRIRTKYSDRWIKMKQNKTKNT